MADKQNAIGGGFLHTNTLVEGKWDTNTIPAADHYSCWVKADSKDGYVSFHYKLVNTDYVGTLRVQAHNDPDASNLDAVNVELSDGTTGVAISSGTDASGFIQVTKNKANYFRMFLDRTSGSATGNTITAVVHQ